MAYDVRETEHAARDLENILRYLDEELGEHGAAVELFAQIERIAGLLRETPLMYPLCEQALLARRGLRKVSFRGYVMVYRFEADAGVVRIMRYFHGLEDWTHKA